jgi:hypothetical protein
MSFEPGAEGIPRIVSKSGVPLGSRFLTGTLWAELMSTWIVLASVVLVRRVRIEIVSIRETRSRGTR